VLFERRKFGFVSGCAVVHRAGAERFWSLCAPSAAKLERIAAVVRSVITAMTVTGNDAAKGLKCCVKWDNLR